jgi:glycosyltransferase involved in cell wall biosynthesis
MEIADSRGFSQHLSILDYVPYEDMPKYYAAADIMLLPSLYDPNPLSVVEALHSALPIALTNRAGNVEEAVTEGRNGWVLPVLDQDAFARKLRSVFSTPIAQLRKMGEHSKAENALFWSTQSAVRNFFEAIGVLNAKESD